MFSNRNIVSVAGTSKVAHREAEPMLLSKFKLYDEINSFYRNLHAIDRMEEKLAKLKVGGEAYKRDSSRLIVLKSMVEQFPARLAAALEYPSVRAQINSIHKGETPLYAAIRDITPDATITRLLLAAGADPNSEAPHDTGSLLHYATSVIMNIDIVMLLIEYGADINTIYTSKYSGIKTPLDSLNDMNKHSSRKELESRGVFDFMEDLRELGAKTYAELSHGA